MLGLRGKRSRIEAPLVGPAASVAEQQEKQMGRSSAQREQRMKEDTDAGISLMKREIRPVPRTDLCETFQRTLKGATLMILKQGASASFTRKD